MISVLISRYVACHPTCLIFNLKCHSCPYLNYTSYLPVVLAQFDWEKIKGVSIGIITLVG